MILVYGVNCKSIICSTQPGDLSPCVNARYSRAGALGPTMAGNFYFLISNFYVIRCAGRTPEELHNWVTKLAVHMSFSSSRSRG